MPGSSRASASPGRELAVTPRRRSLCGDDLDRRRADRILVAAAQRVGDDDHPRSRISSSDGFFGSIGVPAADAARDARAISAEVIEQHPVRAAAVGVERDRREVLRRALFDRQLQQAFRRQQAHPAAARSARSAPRR